MKTILIWGTGKLAKQFVENQCHGDIIGFIETVRTKDFFMQKPVYGSHEIPSGYDYIVIANSYVSEIYNLCLNLRIDVSKIIFLYKVNNRVGCTDQAVIKEILLERNYINYCMEFGLQDSALIEKDIMEYQKLNKRVNFDINEQNMWPIIRDKYDVAGTINNYFLQDLWAARHIIGSGIKKHFDIGSRLDGFIAHLLAADIEVTMIDVREFPGEVEHLYTIVDDATYLHQVIDESVESMSALCSLEHFGLGRYGDSIDPESCFKCFDNIQKKLKKDGELYISVPVGKERVEFNAHRIFYASTVVESFSSLQLVEYSCVAEKKIEYSVDIHKYDNDMHNGEYRYGLFHFVKK
ncbi:MAG: DUF268 domain-containing protein [Lachnospiraceae bacterium]|nr:DUF268 domain-containing protein [Lachnospiraceae bacterium]